MGAETRTCEVQPCIRSRPDLSNNRVVLCSVRCGKYAANICSVPLKKMFSQLLLFLASDMTRPCSSGKQNPQLATQFCSTFLSLLSMKEHSQVWSAKIGRRKNNREAVNQRNLPDAQEYCKHSFPRQNGSLHRDDNISPFNQEVHHRDQNLPGVLNVRLHHQCKMQTTVVFSSILQNL